MYELFSQLQGCMKASKALSTPNIETEFGGEAIEPL